MSISSTVRVSTDRTNFPMIWSERIEAFVSCVPITKVQFEYFLCGIRHPRFDADFYKEILERNPRISPGKVLPNTYHQAFVTGIKPDEAEAFAEWSSSDGDDVYELPTSVEWKQIREEWNGIPDPTFSVYSSLKLTRRAKLLLDRLDKSARKKQNVAGERKLSHFALLNHGVLEWVRWDRSELGWGGLGVPHAAFKAGFTVEDGVPQEPREIDLRPAAYGFRIIKREL